MRVSLFRVRWSADRLTRRAGPGQFVSTTEVVVRAVVLRSFHDPLELEERPDPEARGDDQAVVRILGSGVCHSDLHVAEGYFDSPLPLVLGHEIAGEVDGIGNVLVYTPWGCGDCRFCRRTEEMICPDAKEAGMLPGRRVRRVRPGSVPPLSLSDRRPRSGRGGAPRLRRSDPVPRGEARAAAGWGPARAHSCWELVAWVSSGSSTSGS